MTTHISKLHSYQQLVLSKLDDAQEVLDKPGSAFPVPNNPVVYWAAAKRAQLEVLHEILRHCEVPDDTY